MRVKIIGNLIFQVSKIIFLGNKGKKERERRDADVERYDREDPAVGTRQITNGFAKWAERYLGNCSGQKNNQFQINRMEKWNNRLQAHLAKNNQEGSGEE